MMSLCYSQGTICLFRSYAFSFNPKRNKTVRKKNVNNTLLKNLLDAVGSALAFYAFGYGVAFGGTSESSTFLGQGNFFLKGDVDSATVFFQFCFTATAATIVAGTLAERCQMIAYFCYSIFLTAFVYPVVVHAICKCTSHKKSLYYDYAMEV